MRSRLIITVSVAAALVIGFGYGAYVKSPRAPLQPTVTRLGSATVLPEPQALPAFSLTDQAGAVFGPEQLAGRWSLLFFGFASCGDICPTTLHTLNTATNNESATAQIVFISVDPDRDTPEVLRQYVAGFSPGMIGVTGADTELQKIAAALGASYAVIPEPYRVEHSPAVFLINPDARYTAVFTSPDDAESIAADLARIIGG